LGNTKGGLPSEFLKALQTEDPAFKIRDNDQELAVLAGAELVDVIERAESNQSILASLSLVCSSAMNMRPTPPVRDISELAAKNLGRASINRASGNDSEDEEDTDDLFKELVDIEEVSKPLVNKLRQMRRELAMVSEETNMLWWLFSEHSRDSEERWSNFKFAAVPLMAGKELADLTSLMPGPVAARAFLDRVTRSAKAKPPETVSISEAISSTSLEWRERYLAKYYVAALERLSPITFGIKMSVSSAQDNAWVPAFVQGAQIVGDAKIKPYILAYQLFLEALLSRCWKESE
jgi:hypothetical protein